MLSDALMGTMWACTGVCLVAAVFLLIYAAALARKAENADREGLISERSKYVDWLTNRIPYIEEMGLECTLDFDAKVVRFRKVEDGRQMLLTFENLDDEAINVFAKGETNVVR